MESISTHPLVLFLRVMLRNPRSVSALAPSSKKLARAMTDGLNLKPDDVIMEMGPGTGALTAQIQEILPHSEAYLGIELENKFVRLLQSQYPDLQFVEDTVAHAHQVHAQSGKAPVKVVISGLAMSTLPSDVQEAFIDNLDKLIPPGSLFRMFQYVHAYHLPPAIRFRQRMSELFDEYHRSKVVLKNIPPAFVLTWTR
jgi:phosphatidylethanolamine/phosphatidyl-N-methylethanolamine N-methyltransferase